MSSSEATIFGRVFAQWGRPGVAAYHFDAPENCYLSCPGPPRALEHRQRFSIEASCMAGSCLGRGGRVPLRRLAAVGPGSGIEYGFMSTTTEKAVALRYGQDWDAARGLSYVMEFALDSLNRGALLQWLSQYPGEAEVLYQGDGRRGLRGFT